MPNVGRPSRDCHLCRQRRVKCDLTQPECNRCTRLGRQCPGYRDESDLLFRVEDQASFASSVTRDKRKKRQDKTLSVDNLSSQASTSTSRSPAKSQDRSSSKKPSASRSPVRTSDFSRSPGPNEVAFDHLSQSRAEFVSNDFDPFLPLTQLDMAILKAWHPTISVELPDEPADRSIFPYFLHRFYAPVNPRKVFGFLSFLPPMVEQAGEGSALYLTCRAVAQAFFTNVNNTPGARSQRAEVYSRALIATQAAIQDPLLCTEDETLMAVWLLSLYELIAGDTEASAANSLMIWKVHSSGLISLLTSRGQGQFVSAVGREIFWVVYHTIQIRCFTGGLPCPVESLDWLAQIHPHLDPEEIYPYELSRYGYAASIICSNIRKYIDKLDEPIPAVEEILTDAIALESQSFALMELPLKARASSSASGDPLDLDTVDLRRMTVRTFLCAYRLRLNLSLLQLLTNTPWPSPPANPSDQIESIVATIRSLSDVILSAIPYIFPPNTTPPTPMSLGAQSEAARPVFWTDAIRLLWPLRLIAFWKPSRDDQKLTAFAALKRIGEEMCLRRVVDEFVPGNSGSNVMGGLEMVVRALPRY